MKQLLYMTSAILLSLLLGTSCGQPRPFEQDSTKSVFKYREVYLPEAIGEGADSLGLNTLDEDWAIWGHNLGNVLPEKPSESVFAKVNGATNKKQFCFSSSRLYDYIAAFIEHNYGPNDHARFSIIPNDNDIVCLCVKCQEAGNSTHDASPAVFNLVRKLALQYPNHIFYTSDYRTTHSMPEDSMPENTGVMVSAMPYPFTYGNTPEEESFMDVLTHWGEKTHRILVWDYINNFDDYFTPYPILGVMQNRLQHYRDNHVTAVFLNGSGTDASSFSRLKSIVLAALTANPDVDWENLLKEKAKELYPVTGETIANFILEQEDFIRANGASLPLYAGVRGAMHSYLPVESFMDFYNKLSKLRSKTSGEERRNIDRMLSKLALTQLELKRINGDLSNTDLLLAELENLSDHQIPSYSESGWRIDSYIRDFKFLKNHYDETKGKNKLKGKTLVALTPLDDDYTNLGLLTDGVLGIPSNYHNGHLVNSPEKETSIGIPHIDGAKKLVVWLSYNPGYRIYLPETVSLSGPGMEKITQKVDYPANNTGHQSVEFEIPSSASGSLVLSLRKDPETHSMAIEEIELF